MKITADTNVLIRALVEDHPEQTPLAQAALAEAQAVALSNVAACELVWVLRRGYGLRLDQIADGIERLINGTNLLCDRPAIEAGLDFLRAGADFADGVIAHEGLALGAETFVSFDKVAVRAVRDMGRAAVTPG